MVKGLVHGILEGNRRLRDTPGAEHRGVVAKAFKWSEADARDELRARAPVEPAGEPRVLRGHHRFGGFLRRHLPVVGAGVRQRSSRTRPIRRASSTRASWTALAQARPVRGPEDRDRADHHVHQASLEGDPLLSKDIASSSRPTPAELRPQGGPEPGNTCRRSSASGRLARARRCCCAGMSVTRAVNEFRQQGGDGPGAEQSADGDGVGIASAGGWLSAMRCSRSFPDLEQIARRGR